MSAFCLDIGGTETRGALIDADGHIQARAQGPGGALSLGAAQAETSIRAVWHDIASQISSPKLLPGDIRLFAGIAGLGLAGRVDDLGERLSDFADTHFVGDGYGALIATTGGKPGALISVGTGVAALRLDGAGNTITLSSWGFPGGDLGSGAWLGLRLVNALTKYLDGVPFDPAFPATLAERALKITGNTPGQIMDWLTAGRAGQYASLAPLIVDTAKSGDPFARQMLQAAAYEIVDVAAALYDNKTGDIHLAGGLGGVLLPYCIEQAPAFNWRFQSTDPVLGMHLLATGQAPEEKLLPRPRLSALDYGES